MKEIKLPSGATLKITLSSFSVAKALLQAVTEEAKGMTISGETEIDFNLMKDLLCTALSSKKIEACIWECCKKATYNGIKISEETFEDEDARQDYFTVMLEVSKENLLPFMKSLSAQYGDILKKIAPGQA